MVVAIVANTEILMDEVIVTPTMAMERLLVEISVAGLATSGIRNEWFPCVEYSLQGNECQRKRVVPHRCACPRQKVVLSSVTFKDKFLG